MYKLCELKLAEDGRNMHGSDYTSVISVAQELAINVLKLKGEGLRTCNR